MSDNNKKKLCTYEKVQIHKKMQKIQDELSSMDYLTSKYIDGEDMTQYGDWQEKRKQLRQQYRELENSLNESE